MSLRRRGRRAWLVSRLERLHCRTALRVAAGVLLLTFVPLPVPSINAQQQLPSPRLQRRRQALAEDGVFLPGRSNLPQEASGAYALSPNPAEVIEIILNGDGDSVRLQGYLTRMGDGQSDQGAPLSFFFRALRWVPRSFPSSPARCMASGGALQGRSSAETCNRARRKAITS